MGEGDPQWQHIKDVVKEQLEKAGLKAEGMKGDCAQDTHDLFSLLSVFLSFQSFCASLFHLWQKAKKCKILEGFATFLNTFCLKT